MLKQFVTNNVRTYAHAALFAAWAVLATFSPADAAPASPAVPQGMVKIKGDSYTPLYNPEGTATTVNVASFYLDAKPVTKVDFLRFVQKNERWKRSQAPKIFRDANYLQDWAGDTKLSDVKPAHAAGQPVVNVSWFAARNYCKAQGKRLPTVAEWEYAALAGWTTQDARTDPAFKNEVLRWYVTPADAELPQVGQSKPNYWGLYDMHSLVWEWVDDFGTAISTGDNRSDTDSERSLFCGGSSGLSTDRSDYAAYMRFGFRSSLEPSYSGQNLGFRCAMDME
jgi:formylglycine-generating enzyme required for sulfatase activity